MLAAIHFSIRSPSLLRIATSLLNHIGGVKPAFQVPAAELAFGVLIVAGTLSQLFDFHFVMGKLGGSSRGFSRGQRSYPRRCGNRAAGITDFILLEGVSAGLRLSPIR
jgi:hypothetical protein